MAFSVLLRTSTEPESAPDTVSDVPVRAPPFRLPTDISPVTAAVLAVRPPLTLRLAA